MKQGQENLISEYLKNYGRLATYPKFRKISCYTLKSKRKINLPNFVFRHETETFREAKILHICHCVIHNLKSPEISISVKLLKYMYYQS